MDCQFKFSLNLRGLLPVLVQLWDSKVSFKIGFELLQILHGFCYWIANRGSILGCSRAAGCFCYKCLYFTRCKALQDWSRLKGGPSLEVFCSTFVSAGQLSPLSFRHAKSPDSLAKRVWKSMVLRAPPSKISWRRRVRRLMAPGCGAAWMTLCMTQWNL